MTALLSWLAGHLVWVLVVALLTLVGVVAWVVRGLGERPDAAAGDDAEASGPGSAPTTETDDTDDEGGSTARAVTDAFRDGWQAFKRRLPTTDSQYRAPWVLMLGPPKTGKTALALALDVPSSARGEEVADSDSVPLRWFYHDDGVVLDVSGGLVWRPDGGHDARGWNRLLSLLLRYRPERPLDSIVVTLPAEWLGGSEPGDETSLRELGNALHERLNEIQRQLGMSLPIYVAITRCDALEGFAPFAAALPARLRRGMLGWSSPHARSAAYSDLWVNDAFASLKHQLVGLTTELLAHPEQVSEPDAVFALSEHVHAMLPATRLVLAELFRESAYFDESVFRGLYLTGDTVAGSDQLHLPGRRPHFVRDLFAEKIFPERGLGRARPRGLIDRNRTIRWVQAALFALLMPGLPLLVWTHDRLQTRAEPLTALLTELQVDLYSVQGQYMGEVQPGVTAAAGLSSEEVGALVLLRDMSSIDARNLWSPWMPTSWISPVNVEIEESLEWAFAQVILPTLRNGVVTWADTLGTAEWARDQGGRLTREPPTVLGVELVQATDLPEHEAFVGYLRELRNYGVALNRYNRVAELDQSDIDAFSELVSWYFEEELPPGFRSNDSFYRQALARAGQDPIESAERADFDVAALGIAQGLARNVYLELSRSIRRLSVRIESLELDVPDDLTQARADLAELQRDLLRVESMVSSSESFWFDPTLPASIEVRGLVDSIPVAPFFPAEFGDTGTTRFASRFGTVLDAARREGVTLVRSAIPSAVAETGGGLVQVTSSEEGLRVERAQWLADLRLGLEQLLSAEFMRPLSVAEAEMPPAEMSRPGWNAAALDRVVDDLRQTETFLAEGLARFPQPIQPAVRRAVSLASAARVREGMARAMVFEVAPEVAGVQGREAELSARIASFDAAARRLVQILEVYGARGEIEGEQAIAAVLTLEVIDLLALCDELLDAARIYEMSAQRLDRWSGVGQPAAWHAFGVANAEELEGYLARQREFVQRVSDRFAAPLLGYLQLVPVRDFVAAGGVEIGTEGIARIQRWRAIVEALDQHANQVPDNALGRLESFIRTPMTQAVGPATCPDLAVSRGSAADYFADRQARLERALAARCLELARDAVARGYRALQTHFDQTLAGRFPFVAKARATRAPDADFVAVRTLIRHLDALDADAAGAPVEILNALPGAGEASRFVERLQQLRPLLSVMVADSSVPPQTGVEWQVDFRTRRAEEVGADQIIEWALQIGDVTTRYGDPADERVGGWRAGMRVELALRWAEGSALRPLSSAIVGVTGPEVEGDRARWSYEGPWSLLRLIVDHQQLPSQLGAAATASSARDGINLLFEVVTAPMAAANSLIRLDADRTTRVWLTLQLSERETGRVLQPELFPVSAPPLGQE